LPFCCDVLVPTLTCRAGMLSCRILRPGSSGTIGKFPTAVSKHSQMHIHCHQDLTTMFDTMSPVHRGSSWNQHAIA
jgi:hypothetical protein